MTKATTDWTRGVNDRTPAPIAAAQTVTVDINLATLAGTSPDKGADRYEVLVDYLKGASSGIRIDVFSSPDDGVTVATIPESSAEYSADANIPLIFDGPWRRISITNLDGSNATGNVGVTSAWRQWDNS